MYTETAIVPVGGAHTRMGGDMQKCLAKTANGRVVLEQVVAFWKEQGIKRFLLVLNDDIGPISVLMDTLCMDEDITWGPVWNAGGSLPEGISRCRTYVAQGPVLLALGDCLFDGEFGWKGTTTPRGERGSPTSHRFSSYYTYFAVQCGDPDFNGSYAVKLEDGSVSGIIEKPVMGLGAWWMGSELLECFKGSDLMTCMEEVMKQRTARPVYFDGKYLNVTHPVDLERWG